MAEKYFSFGATFEINEDPTASPSNWVNVPSLRTITPPPASRAIIDLSTHDTTGGYDDSRPAGLKRSGEAEMLLVYDYNEAGHALIKSLFESGATFSWRIRAPEYSPPVYYQGEGYIVNWNPNPLEMENAQEVSFTFKVRGEVTLGPLA